MLTAIVLVLCLGDFVQSNTLFTEETSYYTTLMELYNPANISMTDVIARVNSSYARTLAVSVGLLAIQDFDEVEGTLEILIKLRLEWRDEIVVASGYTHDSLFNFTGSNTAKKVQSMLIPYGKIWTPKLVLVNSADEMDTVGSMAYRPRYNFENGQVTWEPRVKVRSACSPDVTFYPFDKQTCEIEFTDWGQTSSELAFKTVYDDWDMSTYSENGEWTVTKTQVSTQIKWEQSWLKLTVSVERKPLYFAFNIILPILVLVVLNGMVFWLPVESGERIGFSVTCFLSFVVLLNMVMDILPRSSSPMSYLCYYTVCMMIFSGALTAVVILQMRLFHKPEGEKVPGCIQKCVRAFRCNCTKNQNMSIVDDMEEFEKKTGKDRLTSKEKIKTKVAFQSKKDDDEITWSEVTRFLDKFFFLIFVIGQSLFTFIFIVPIAANV